MALMVHLSIHIPAGLPFSSVYFARLQLCSAALRRRPQPEAPGGAKRKLCMRAGAEPFPGQLEG
ncbi:hypothetical protein D3C80_2107350 [compost metagenome]